MPDCCSSLSRPCCCRRQSQHDYIYLYTPPMAGSSSSSAFRCLVYILIGFCLTFVLILTIVTIRHLNNNNFISSSSNENINQLLTPMAKKRQLPEFVNISIDPCEHFYDFVCDKWSRRIEVEKEQKWTRIRHKIHDKLMLNMNNSHPKSSESISISKFYQLCETQSSSVLFDEFERYFSLLIDQEPYRSYLTLFNQKKSTSLTSSPIIFQYNPFFKIVQSSSNNNNQSFSTIIRINPRPLPSPLAIFPNLTILNQTALNNLVKFDHDYTKFLHEANDRIKLYEQEYNQDSLIIKRILSFNDYHRCLPSVNMTNGLQNLFQLLNHFFHYRLRQFNTKLMNKQIRQLEKINDNHTLVDHLRRIRLEFKIIAEIVPLENPSGHNNSSCIINLLDKLLDKRLKLNELPSSINLYFPNTTLEYIISNDWPYLVMLYDYLLKKIPTDTLVNFVFFDYYRHLIYPYYQPHIRHSIDSQTNQRNDPNLTCHVNSCFDILNCYHPSALNQLIDDNNQISLNSIKTIVQNLLNRFRLLIDQSDHLFNKEKILLINKLNQMKILFGHYSSLFYSFPHLNSSSYLEYVQLFSTISYDQQIHSYSIEPIYYSLNHTLFLPYGFIHSSNNSIEYVLIKIFLKILSQTIQSNPFYIECLIKSSDDFNTTIDTNNDHMIYLLSRTKFLFEENIILDEYLWPFISTNSILKHFLIDYTVNNYCQNLHSYDLFLNNMYLINDVYLVFHCQQASSIKQSKCFVN